MRARGVVPLDPAIVGREIPPYERAWRPAEAMLYALAVGSGHTELAFVTENSHGVSQQVLPTFAVIIASPERILGEIGDLDRSQMLHAGQRVVVHRPIPPDGIVTVRERVAGLYDKGAGKAALLTLSATGELADGSPLFGTEMTILVRGAGGFGGDPGPTRGASSTPSSPPNLTVDQRTTPDQALLYRLTGDRTPTHSDPWYARERAGFPRPILQGLCTFGFVGRALLFGACAGDPACFRSMSARFSAPVFPGDTLTTRIWRTRTGSLFSVTASPDDRVVLADGELLRA